MMYIFLQKKAKLFANGADPDQTPRSAASDLGLHWLPITFKRYPEYNGLNSYRDDEGVIMKWSVRWNAIQP